MISPSRKINDEKFDVNEFVKYMINCPSCPIFERQAKGSNEINTIDDIEM